MREHWKSRRALVDDWNRALDRGASPIAPGNLKSDVSADCSNPQWVLVSYTDQHKGPYRTWRGNMEYLVPCRQCENCRERRSKHWAARIHTETNQATRSWFATLTLAPEQHYLALLRAERAARRRGVEPSTWDDRERFLARTREVQKEVTLFLKRVRKVAPIRYCLVVESHRSGLPHIHAVIHERDVPVRHRALTESWRVGFSQFKLVAHGENRAVSRYVAKYLTKSWETRVRASKSYGYLDPGLEP